MDEVLKTIKDIYPTYIEDSIYRCDDGLTFMFKIESDDKVHTCYIDIKTKQLVFI